MPIAFIVLFGAGISEIAEGPPPTQLELHVGRDAGFLAAVVDFLFFLFDDNAQSLHDKIMETVVVRPVPESQPRMMGNAPPATASLR